MPQYEDEYLNMKQMASIELEACICGGCPLGDHLCDGTCAEAVSSPKADDIKTCTAAGHGDYCEATVCDCPCHGEE